MTAQSHVEAIATALWKVEKLSRETKRKALETQQAVRELHELLDAAQQEYSVEHGGIQPLSGGTDKPPPPPDPEEPVEP